MGAIEQKCSCDFCKLDKVIDIIKEYEDNE